MEKDSSYPQSKGREIWTSSNNKSIRTIIREKIWKEY